MIKTKELMLGDWVYMKAHRGFDSQYIKVETIPDSSSDTHYGHIGAYPISEDMDFRDIEDSNLEPIPLTPEILEKNGFTYCKSDGGFYLHTTISYGNWDVDVVLFDVTDEYRNNQLHISSPDDSYIAIHLMECNHVHELQHALRLCGIEKEIEL